MTVPLIPESAPFSPEQRAWLNGFFAGAFGIGPSVSMSAPQNGAPDTVTSARLGASDPVAPLNEEEYAWHDPALPLEERLKLAEGKPLEHRLMAAMAQLDCGACGYVCQTYSAAIAGGAERDLTKCSPGGSATQKQLKLIVAARQEGTNANGSTNGDHPGAASGATHGAAFRANGSHGVLKTSGTPGSSRSHPLRAHLLESRRLTHEEAAKDTRHVVIELGESGLQYVAGDSLGVLPINCPDLVDDVLNAYDATGDELVTVSGADPVSVRQALAECCALNRMRAATLECMASAATDARECADLRRLMANDDDEFLQSADVLDALMRFPSARPALQELVNSLGPMLPRLYSISSSPRKHPGQVHLTVGIVQFEVHGRVRNGVASSYLGVRSQPGDAVSVYVQPSRFRLPADPDTPVIMVGPGTGIAPFRAFLEEREATRAPGPNWLFFGNQYFHYDYLYRSELDRWADCGLLTRLDVAFSRDTARKVYVQDRIREHGAELWRWLEAGAHFYICGDAKRMAVDVDQALREVIANHGHCSPEDAKQYTTNLAKARRYQRDVY